jgi:hypothetical protein
VVTDDHFIWFTDAPTIALRVNPPDEKIDVRAGGPLLLQPSPPALISLWLQNRVFYQFTLASK